MEGQPMGFEPQNESIQKGDQAKSYLSQAIESGILLQDLQKAVRSLVNQETQNTPISEVITPEVRENMERLGMDLFQLPRIDFGTKSEISRPQMKTVLKRPEKFHLSPLERVDIGVQSYLSGLEVKYPNLFPRYEGLTGAQKKDSTVWRNLEENFWEKVKNGTVVIPELNGKWIIAETIPKPAKGESYQLSPITEMLGLQSRFNLTYDEVTNAITENKEKILSALGLKTGDVRLLTAIEWNYLANVEGWGATNTYEYTATTADTRYRDDPTGQLMGWHHPVIVGNSERGGAAAMSTTSTDTVYDSDQNSIGFRIAIIP